MKMDDIRALAREIGIKPGKLNKTQLVHSIQRQEGNFDCFASAANGECDQWGCRWRESCFTTAAKQAKPKQPTASKAKKKGAKAGKKKAAKTKKGKAKAASAA